MVSLKIENILCCNSKQRKNKQIANTLPAVAPVVSNVSWDCLPPCPNVWSLPVSDQVSFCHALSHPVLHFVKTRAQQQQTNNNKQTWKHFAFKMVHCRFSHGFARNRSNLEITCMKCQHLPWQQIVSGKMWPKSCQGLNSFSRVGSCHLYFSLFGFWFMIEDCKVTFAQSQTKDTLFHVSPQRNTQHGPNTTHSHHPGGVGL